MSPLEQAVEDAFVAFEALGFVNVTADADYWARRDALVSTLRRLHFQEAAEALKEMPVPSGPRYELYRRGVRDAGGFLRGLAESRDRL